MPPNGSPTPMTRRAAVSARRSFRLGPKKMPPPPWPGATKNLSGSSLAQAVGGVLKGAAEKDIAGAAALVTGMDPLAARAEAAVAVARKWFPEMSSGEAAKPEAVAWLAGLDPTSVKRVLDECAVQWGWACSDPKSMAAFSGCRRSRPNPCWRLQDLGAADGPPESGADSRLGQRPAC